MNIEPVEMTTPTNVEMLKELNHALEALNAERTMGPIHNPQNAAATNAVMRSIECFCSPMIRAVQSPENAKTMP